MEPRPPSSDRLPGVEDEDEGPSDLPDGWREVPVGSGWFGYTTDPESLARRYGVTPDEYHAMRDAQHDSCAICGRESVCVGPLVVDHDHSANGNRELLCQRCNRGIGQFLEVPEFLRNALEYIERHGSWATRGEPPPDNWFWNAPDPPPA